jgi:hypothetical protein
MPFGSKFSQPRAYKAGDFIFGLNDAVNKFKQKHVSGKSGPSDAVVTVRQFTNVIDDIGRFSDDRFDQNYAYLDSMLNHPKYHSAVVSRDLGIFTKEQPGGEGSNESFRRKSKGALNFLVSQEKYIHFILDGLEIDDVAEKQNFVNKQDKSPQLVSSGGPPKYRDVTGAELRWIFRHKDDPATQKCVQFWLKDNFCAAPWEMQEYQQAWTEYGLKSAKKTI